VTILSFGLTRRLPGYSRFRPFKRFSSFARSSLAITSPCQSLVFILGASCTDPGAIYSSSDLKLISREPSKSVLLRKVLKFERNGYLSNSKRSKRFLLSLPPNRVPTRTRARTKENSSNSSELVLVDCGLLAKIKAPLQRMEPRRKVRKDFLSRREKETMTTTMDST